MAYAGKQVVRARPSETYISRLLRQRVPHSCARARTVASEVFTEAQSFADCKLHIRTRLLASASSNFWKTPPLLEFFDAACRLGGRYDAW